MRLFISLAFAIGFCSFITACGGEADHKQHETEASSEKPQETASTATTSVSVKMKSGELDAVYQHYVHLTNALVKNDAAEARVAANAIATGANDLQNGSSIGSAARSIAASSDIEQQRSSYAKLSDELIKTAKSSGVEAGEVYVDYCPMAMNNKGAYWLSSKKEIRNPYFGDKMLECGEVKETLK